MGSGCCACACSGAKIKPVESDKSDKTLSGIVPTESVYKPMGLPKDADLPFKDSEPLGTGKALTVAIKYTGTDGYLSMTWYDQDHICDIFEKYFKVKPENMVKLRDDGKDEKKQPTKANILGALKSLVTEANAGDRLFFAYSGHGSQKQDVKGKGGTNHGDEHDFLDETLVPIDATMLTKDKNEDEQKQKEMQRELEKKEITDDELRDVLLQVKEGVTMFVLLDCCHSGSLLDLAYEYKVDPSTKTINMKEQKVGWYGNSAKNASNAEAHISGSVVMLSAAKDSQVAKNNSELGGIFTAAFSDTITKKPRGSFEDILVGVQSWLTENKKTQVPQMSSSWNCPLNVNASFLLGPQKKVADK